jgi:methylmalonyl-CoA mutase cobalamin-binding subunit
LTSVPSTELVVGDQAFAGLDQILHPDAEHVVPSAGGSPRLVLVVQVGVDEHPQWRGVTRRRLATVGYRTPLSPTTPTPPQLCT